MNFPAKSPPTIRDLARLTGLSKSTVANALRDNGQASAKTRARVHALARKIGYVPNTFAAALSSSKTPRPVDALRVAYVTHSGAPAYHAATFLATRSRLQQLGYETDWFDLHRDSFTVASLHRTLFHRGYRGIILSENHTEDASLTTAAWDSFSVVCTYRTYSHSLFDFVRKNPFQSIALAWRKIREAGYSRIGFLLCRHAPRMLDDLEREGALFALQQELTAQESAVPPYLGEHGDHDAIHRWYQCFRPDAVVGFVQLHYDMFRHSGVRIPRDLAFALLHSWSGPTHFAGVDPGNHLIPGLCADHIDQLIRHQQTGRPDHPREILAPVSWQPGRTLPPKSG